MRLQHAANLLKMCPHVDLDQNNYGGEMVWVYKTYYNIIMSVCLYMCFHACTKSLRMCLCVFILVHKKLT